MNVPNNFVKISLLVIVSVITTQLSNAQSVDKALELDSMLYTNRYVAEDSIYYITYSEGGKEGGYPMDSIQIYVFRRGYHEIYTQTSLPKNEIIERKERLLLFQKFGNTFDTSKIKLLDKYSLFSSNEEDKWKCKMYHNTYSTEVYILPNGEYKIIETKYGLPPERLNPILEVKGNIYIKLLD